MRYSKQKINAQNHEFSGDKNLDINLFSDGIKFRGNKMEMNASKMNEMFKIRVNILPA